MSAGRVTAWTHQHIQKVLHRTLTDRKCWNSFPGFQWTSEIKRSSGSVRERERERERVGCLGGGKKTGSWKTVRLGERYRGNDISLTGVQSDTLSFLSHPFAASGWIWGQTQRFPQSSFLKRFIITLKKVIVSNECLQEQRILLCLLVSVYVCVFVGACERSCVYRSSIAILSGRTAHSRWWERERKCSVVLPGHQRPLVFIWGLCVGLTIVLKKKIPFVVQQSSQWLRYSLSLSSLSHTHTHTHTHVWESREVFLLENLSINQCDFKHISPVTPLTW